MPRGTYHTPVEFCGPGSSFAPASASISHKPSLVKASSCPFSNTKISVGFIEDFRGAPALFSALSARPIICRMSLAWYCFRRKCKAGQPAAAAAEEEEDETEGEEALSKPEEYVPTHVRAPSAKAVSCPIGGPGLTLPPSHQGFGAALKEWMRAVRGSAASATRCDVAYGSRLL